MKNLLFYIILRERKSPDYPYWNYNLFDLNLMPNDQCKSKFKIFKNDMFSL